MRLRRIEAVRFGALQDVCVGDLSDTLTVVHGPNEAGKSTLVALVRGVLYGFPTKGDREAYVPAGGGRLGRLVFVDDAGEWIVERSEGTKGGAVTVRTVRGPDRPDLVSELTRGVDKNAYRVIFGFGLDDMDAIEDARKDSASVAGALYAASAGVRVSPEAIRKALEDRRKDLFLPTGQRRINRLLADLSHARVRLREAREASERYAQDRERLEKLSREQEELRREQEELQGRVQAIAGDLQRVESAMQRMQERSKELESAEESRRALEAEAAALVVDRRLLDTADTVDALVRMRDSASQAAHDAARHRERARGAAAEAERLCRSAGLERDAAMSIAVDGPLATAVESARDDITRLQSEAVARTRELERAEANAQRARAEAARALEPLGLDAAATQQDLDRLLAEIDASEEETEPLRGQNRALAVALILLGLFIFAAGGLWLRERMSLLAGPAVFAAGVVALVKDMRARPQARLARPDSVRRRRLIDAARVALQRSEAASAELEQASADLTAAEGMLAARKELLARDLEASGLPRDLDPRSAAGLLDTIRRAQRHDAEAREAAEEAERLTRVVERFVHEVQEVAGAVGFEGAAGSFEEASSALSVLQDRLAEARERDKRLEAVKARIAQLDARTEELARVSEEAQLEARGVLERYERPHASLEGLRAVLADAHERLSSVSLRLQETAAARSALAERLESFASDEEAAQAHLDEAALVQQIADAVDEYVVLALAERLVARAQARYEKERQPDVLKDAERVFRGITGDRYQRVIVPLGGGRIEVHDVGDTAKEAGKLSKGTAEALYLALRLGLVGRLEDVAPGLPMLIDDVLANFDPERLDGAVAAIAALSCKRQVVFFTCHDALARKLLAAGPESTTLIELPRRV